jgi:uncharacterized protein YxjI
MGTACDVYGGQEERVQYVSGKTFKERDTLKMLRHRWEDLQ